jgi:hypothetical protein
MPTMTELNQQAGKLDFPAGHNNPPETIDWGAITAERLAKDYEPQTNLAAKLAEEEQALGEEYKSDQEIINAGALIKRARELHAQLEDKRVVEGTPGYRIFQTCNGFFKSVQKALQPETPKERNLTPGLIDRVQGRINKYQDKKEAEAREVIRLREAEATRVRLAAEKEAREKQAEADRLAAKAKEELAAAERARAPAKVEEKTNKAIETAREATQAAGDAAKASAVATQAANQAQDARIAALAPAKDIVRTSGVAAGGQGVLHTKKTVKFAYVVDRSKMTDADKLKLFEHFNDADLDKAVRSFANGTRYLQTLTGCEIGTRQDGVTR